MVDYDAVLIISFGGPEGPDDVMPFLDNVTRRRPIPPARKREVAERYLRLGGVSPINGQCRRLVSELEAELSGHSLDLPVYWGNRNWNPMLVDTVAAMANDGIKHALAFVTSAYSSYSSCRQYLDDIEQARAMVGKAAPLIDKIRPYFDHPGFVEPFARATSEAVAALGDPSTNTRIVFTAHSIPASMAATCEYQEQLSAVARLITDLQPTRLEWDLVWQSRSGPPTVAWLEPDINDHLRRLADDGVDAVAIVPIGFVFDHMEVVFDLDDEAASTAADLGIQFTRAATPATLPQPEFISMGRELIQERLETGSAPRFMSDFEPRPDRCPTDCCPPG